MGAMLYGKGRCKAVTHFYCTVQQVRTAPETLSAPAAFASERNIYIIFALRRSDIIIANGFDDIHFADLADRKTHDDPKQDQNNQNADQHGFPREDI